MGVCLGGALGFIYCSILADGVEDIGDGIAVDVDVVDSLQAGFIEYLVKDFAICAEWISHGVWKNNWDNAWDNACFFGNKWHHDVFVKGFRDLVEDGAFGLVEFLEAIDGYIVEYESFCFDCGGANIVG